jgi:hypothetical protein
MVSASFTTEGTPIIVVFDYQINKATGSSRATVSLSLSPPGQVISCLYLLELSLWMPLRRRCISLPSLSATS